MKIVNSYVPGVPALRVKAELMAVLTEDEAGKFAVYVAIVPGGTATDEALRVSMADHVARHGTKQTLANARAYFPFLTEADYRA